jgi:hypothetical protein
MMRRLSSLLSFAFLVATPAFAQSTSSGSGVTFASLVDTKIVPFVDTAVIPLLYVLAFLFFMIGVARYFFTGGEENREKGKAFVLWGLIGMVAIFGIWGVVRLLLSAIPGT